MLEEADFPIADIYHKMQLKDGLNFYSTEIDAVFLDLTLPDSSGFNTLQLFLDTHPKANVIIMTGLSDRQMGIRAVKAGAQDYIIKGEYEPDSLVRSLYYSIERTNILKRLEQTQQIARIGSWEYNYQNEETTVSDDIFQLFNEPAPKQKKFSAEDVEHYRELHFFRMAAPVELEVYEHFQLGKKEIVKKEIIIDVSGQEKCFDVQAYISRFQDGYPILHGVVQDISEKKMTEQLRKEKELALESAKLKEIFITNVSHEMRTPMNAILGMSNILMNTQMSGEQMECVSSIHRSSELLLGIVNDILEMSSLQHGKITFEKKDFDLSRLLTDLSDIMQYKLTEKELTLEIHQEQNVPKIITGDPLRLNQVLFNLVGNAVKFTDEGKIILKISNLHSLENTITLQFEIQDTGIGIPEDQIDNVFETFSRVRSKERLFEGTGLGLSIARNIVTQKNGKMWVHSQLGQGSSFFFTMDFELAANQNGVSKINKYQNLKVDPQHHFSLLLVEDNKLNQLVAKKTLEKQWPNIHLKIAGHGLEAIEILKEQAVDLILMDIQMPVMDGYEATEYIKKNMPERAGIPIIAMTAFAHIAKEEKFKAFGMDDFVLKPFDPDDFYYKVAIYSNNAK
ncbi:MAG: response regulator [Saprospiraceae bacterium]